MATKGQQQRVEAIRSLFYTLLGHTCTITFDTHEFCGILTDIAIQKTTGFKLAPEKRVGEDGKAYSPTLIKLVFDNQNELVFVDEDVDWTIGVACVTIRPNVTGSVTESATGSFVVKIAGSVVTSVDKESFVRV